MKASFSQSVSIKLMHEIFLIIALCVIMAFCSFASLVSGTCGPSPENPNVVHFVDLKACDRDVNCNIRRMLKASIAKKTFTSTCR